MTNDAAHEKMLSDSASSGVSDEGDWLDVEPDEEEGVLITSLFDSTETFPSVAEMVSHCREHNKFDLAAVLRSLQLEFHDAVKLVNFVRASARDGQALPKPITRQHFESDDYLKPVLENDALLFSLDEILDGDDDESPDSNGRAAVTDAAANGSDSDVAARNRALEAELESVRGQFANYRLTVEETLDRRWGDDKEPSKVASEPKKTNSDYYFESYAGNEIHETMLKDAIRTDAYRDFIYDNKNLFEGKVVLDIGCGTGILSMFCAKAGAKQVIAVDKSDIIVKAQENIFNNGLSDKITCLRGAIEDVVLPVKEVDIIVSEWMGYCLLYEAMLPSVLHARDRYLKPDGLLVPSSATIWMAPVSDPEYVSDYITYWRDVYGFNMKAMQEGIYDEARVEVMPKTCLAGSPHPFKVLDLHTVKAQDLVFSNPWQSTLDRDIDELDGFLMWFDMFFATSRKDSAHPADTTPEAWTQKTRGNVSFTTGPAGTATHWKQGLFVVAPEKADQGLSRGTNLSGTVDFQVLEENDRALTISVSWSSDGRGGRKQLWKLK